MGEGRRWGAVSFHLEGQRNVAQLPCFVMAVHCAVHPGNIKLPVLCIKLQDRPWISDSPVPTDAAPGANKPTCAPANVVKGPNLKVTPADGP